MDNDQNHTGQKAALKLKKSLLSNHEVCIVNVPRLNLTKGIDWLDVSEIVGRKEALEYFNVAVKDAIFRFNAENDERKSDKVSPNVVANRIYDLLRGESSFVDSLAYMKVGGWFTRNKDSEVFEFISSKRVKELITLIMQKHHLATDLIKGSFVSDVEVNLRGMLYTKNNFPFIHGVNFNTENVLFTKNSVLRVAHNKIDEFKYELSVQFTANRLKAEFVPGAKSEVFLPLVCEILSGDLTKINAFQEFMGFCLFGEYRQHKFLVLYGKGRNGKGVLCTPVKALVGDYTSLSLNDMNLEKNRFKLAKLQHSAVNFSNDDDFSSANIEIVKTLSAGEEVSVEHKNQDPFEFKNRCKIIVSTNKPMMTKDDSNSIWDRLMFIPIDFEVRDEAKQNHNFSKVDWWLEQPKEMSGILNWAIEGWQRLLEQGAFTKLDNHEDLIEESRRFDSPERDFLLDHYEEFDEPLEVFTKDIYDGYKKWASDGGFKVKNIAQIGRAISLTFPKARKAKSPKATGIGQGKANYWMGLQRLSGIEGKADSDSNLKIISSDYKEGVSDGL